MATNFVTISEIAAESLTQLESNLVVGSLLYKDTSQDWQGGNYAKGQTISIKTRPSFETKEFATDVELQDVRESSATMTIEKHFDISVPWTSSDAAMNMDGVREQIIAPMMISLSQKIDTYLLSKITGARGLYADTALFKTAGSVAQARKVANEQQVASSGRIALIDSSLEADVLSAVDFNRNDARGTGGITALEEASMGRIMNMQMYGSTNFTPVSHTLGDGTAVTKAVPAGTENAVGTSVLVLNAASSGTFQVNDRIYIAGMRRPLIVSTQVLATGTSIPLLHQIDEIVPVGAAVTVVAAGNTSYDHAGIILDPNSFAYATPALESPAGADSAVMNLNGLSIRLVRQYDIIKKRTVLSADILCGAQAYDGRQSVLLGRATA